MRRLLAMLFIAVVGAMLAAPAFVQFALPRGDAVSENRNFATWPATPRRVAEALAYPGQVNAYIQDNFGLRSRMIAAYDDLRYAAFRELPSRQVIEGRHHRLFFTSHVAAYPFSLIRMSCGWDVAPAAVERAAQDGTSLLRHLRTVTPRALIAIVPTAPVIYTEDLPPWLQRECAQPRRPAEQVEALLGPDIRGDFVYPLAEFLSRKPSQDVYLHSYFHWAGLGLRSAAEALAERNLGLQRRFDMPLMSLTLNSDLSQFLAGLQFRETFPIPDFQKTTIEHCERQNCFPGLEDITRIFNDHSWYRVQGGGPRILVLSDSFGVGAAQYFAQYAGEVRHFAANNIRLLSREQVDRFRRTQIDEFRPDIIAVIFHDAAVLNALGDLDESLWPPGP